MLRVRPFAIAALLFLVSTPAYAQLTAPRTLQGVPQRTSRLEEQLINGLKATRFEQQTFLRNVVTLVDQKKLDQRLVSAIYIWAIRRQPVYPFPYFERGLRAEAKRRSVVLPPVASINRSGTLTLPQSLR